MVRGPDERDGFAVRGPREVSERLGDVGIVGDETAALHKDAKGRPEFVKVGRGNHAADGVQVLSARRTPKRPLQSQKRRSGSSR